MPLRDIAGLGFGWTDHAYGSIFFLLAGFVVMVAVAALIVVALTLYWAVRGQYSPRRHANVANSPGSGPPWSSSGWSASAPCIWART